MTKPPINVARETSDLSMMPPFVFEGVVMRVMPLKANMFVLSQFCDNFLNFDNEGQADLFRPAFPFVFLAIVNYGRLAPQFSNDGWVAQNEVAFSIFLEWYKRDGDRWVFHDWATVSPFIYVDNPGSLTTGREVYGWPKTLAKLSVGLDAWVKHPHANEELLRLSTAVTPSGHVDERQVERVLVEVDRTPPHQKFVYPLNPKNPLNLLGGLSQIASGSVNLGQTVLDSMARSKLRGYHSSAPDFFSQLWQTISSADPANPMLRNNTINLKQFRDAANPSTAAYQAIIASQLEISRINGAGPLGEIELLRGDTSGGFTVRIHRYDSQPIVESLGLEYVEAHQLRETNIFTLKPLMPFWLDLDLTASAGEALRWRTRDIEWTTGDEEPRLCSTEDAAKHRREHRYNTTRGAATEAAAGSLWLPNATIRVLPLLADRDRLQDLCNAYFDREFWQVEPFGSYVYMMVVNHERIASESNNNIAGMARRHVNLSIPVKVYSQDTGERVLEAVRLFSPFRYTDSNDAAIIGREVYGWPTLFAEIDSPGSNWIRESGPASDYQGLLHVRTDVLPAIDAGQEMQRKKLFEVFTGEILPYNDDVNRRLLAVDWAPDLLSTLQAKQKQRDLHGEHLDGLKALALEVLANRRSIREISLKQFRDAADPSRACLQTIVDTGWQIERIFDLREMDDAMIHVGISHWPSQPIVDQLGLKAKWLDLTTGETPISYCEPIRPFWAKVALRTEPARDLAWRVSNGSGFAGAVKGSKGWFRARHQDGVGRAVAERERAPESSARPEPGLFGSGAPEVGRKLVDLVEKIEEPDEFFGALGRRQNLRLAMIDWLSSKEGSNLTREEAIRAIEGIDEPQAAIESILSAEWEHWGNPLWWQRQQQIDEAKARLRVRRSDDEAPVAAEEEATIEQKDEFFICDQSLGPNLSRMFWGQQHGLKKTRRVEGDYWCLKRDSGEIAARSHSAPAKIKKKTAGAKAGRAPSAGAKAVSKDKARPKKRVATKRAARKRVRKRVPKRYRE